MTWINVNTSAPQFLDTAIRRIHVAQGEITVIDASGSSIVKAGQTFDTKDKAALHLATGSFAKVKLDYTQSSDPKFDDDFPVTKTTFKRVGKKGKAV